MGQGEPDPPSEERLPGPLYRLTFPTADRGEQMRSFSYWCGWFGFDENDEPDKIEGNTWLIRKSMEEDR